MGACPQSVTRIRTVDLVQLRDRQLKSGWEKEPRLNTTVFSVYLAMLSSPVSFLIRGFLCDCDRNRLSTKKKGAINLYVEPYMRTILLPGKLMKTGIPLIEKYIKHFDCYSRTETRGNTDESAASAVGRTERSHTRRLSQRRISRIHTCLTRPASLHNLSPDLPSAPRRKHSHSSYTGHGSPDTGPFRYRMELRYCDDPALQKG